MRRSDRLLLNDIRGAIEQIERHVQNMTFDRFRDSVLHQDAVVRRLEIVGEAARHLSEETLTTLSDVPWADVVAMRNRLTHAYFTVDLLVVWETVKDDLPALREAVVQALGRLPGCGGDPATTPSRTPARRWNIRRP